MEHVNDVDLDCVLGLPVPDAADRIRYTQPRRRRKRSSEETTGGPKPPNPTCLIQDILLINAGEDVVKTIFSHFTKISSPSHGRLGIILSATGSVLNPIILTKLLVKSFQGSFPITSLTGHFIIHKSGRVNPYDSLNIIIRGSDGELFGGRVVESLIAATEIQLCLGSFPHEA